MAHSLSAKKRIRQNEKRRQHNHAIKARAKTASRRFLEAVKAGELEKAEAYLAIAYKRIDKAVKRHIFHKNAGARKKSRLAQILNEAKQEATASTNE